MNRRFASVMAVAALGAAQGSALPALAALNPGAQQQPPTAAPAQQPAPAAGGAPAQQPASPGVQPSKESGAPLSKLGLSEEQKKQVHEIHKKTEQQVQEVRGNTSLTEQQQRQQIRQLRRGGNQQVESLLTPEQREKYDAWRRAQRQRRHHPQPPQQQPPSQ